MSEEQSIKTVALAKCDDYGRVEVCKAVARAIGQLGGIGVFVAPGQKVLVKFNLLNGSAPEKCVTTHPEVVYAVAKILKEHGCAVVLGDSPGSGSLYTEASLRKAYAASGYAKVAEELGVTLNYDTSHQEISAPASQTMKRFPIITPALDADAIVVVSKAKTHSLTYLSGAAKNLFGVIPGLEKPAYHAKLPAPADFSRMIVDLNQLVKPKLQIMDAIIGMEGDGPMGGTPRKIGAVLASGDYSAIDVATCRLMSIDPLKVGTIKTAVERGCLKADFSDVSVIGDDLENLIVRDYKAPATYAGTGIASSNKRDARSRIMLGVASRLANELSQRPIIHLGKCTSCLKCVRSCPVKTIAVVDKKPRISYDKCIKCYCCHEMCDSHAISLERTLTGKVMAKIVTRQ